MKHLVSILLLALCTVLPAQDAPQPGSPNDLAAPLRRFDRNKDGKLDDAEMKEARQTHNRGGRDAEPNPQRWKEQLQRREREFVRDRERDFDTDGDGKLSDAEKKTQREVWQQIAAEFTKLRIAITAKYDRNDDGELNDQERNASRQENDRQRREIEDRCIKEWREKQNDAEKKVEEKKDEGKKDGDKKSEAK